ncbi:MAG: RNA polymerase-associated protein RapA, partial [Verrucomicrobiota bacterium]
GFRVGLSFPASGEQRLYAAGSSVLKRVIYRVGEKVATRDGANFSIESVEEEGGLVVYSGEGLRTSEADLTDIASVNKPHERLMSAQTSECSVFDLRFDALKMRSRLRSSDTRGFLGGRVDLIPHQFYILNEVSSRQNPRVLLSDEVGLGKTIEACLIMQRMRSIGRADRVLILVPESLVHQWFVELLRRFNLWFSIFDEERCRAVEHSNPGKNPFLDEQLALCGVNFLSESEVRSEQAIEAGWDLVIVDEAHHLEWTQESASSEYEIVEKLGAASPGLLLLTATPTSLGMEGHFARLRLLDPDRYGDFDSFKEEAEDFGSVAEIAGKIVDGEDLSRADHKELKRIFDSDREGLEKRLEDLDSGKRGARRALIRALLDEHGTGRVVFRNSRTNMKGFPKRMYCSAPLEAGDDPDKTLLKKLVREMEAEANEHEETIRYSFKDDPRLDWLVAFLKARKGVKTLLICKTRLKAMAIEAALKEKMNVKAALFHEELQLVQRDRNAAWFAEEDGAQLLICSEIGSEGRNFQFAHHLALFDIPLNPGLLEQRIGRLDRIGQTATIQVHVPYVVGSCQEFVAEWYHQGLDAFEMCVHGGREYVENFSRRLLEYALEYGSGSSRKKVGRQELEAFIEETSSYRAKLDEKLMKGRDRLLELNSFDGDVANGILKRVRRAESDTRVKDFVFEVMDHFGVRIDEHEDGESFIDPSHAYVEAFPSLPSEGALVTFDRGRAISREDIVFVSPDHEIVGDTLDLLINSERGTSSFGIVGSDTQNLMLEAIFELETIALSRLHVDRFLAPTPIRILVDVRGTDLSHELDTAWMKANVEEGNINRFLERPGFNSEFLNAMLQGAEDLAETEAKSLKSSARKAAKAALMEEVTRLLDLQKINKNVREDEVDSAKEELTGVLQAIEDSRVKLDSIRLIVTGMIDGLEA